MWTLTFWTITITVLVIALSYSIHRWIGIRRDKLGDAAAARADGFWEWFLAKAKARWDVTTAAVIAAAPVLWSVVIDGAMITVNLLATLFPALAGQDWSALMITDKHKAYISLGALVVPLLRDAIEKMRAK